MFYADRLVRLRVNQVQSLTNRIYYSDLIPSKVNIISLHTPVRMVGFCKVKRTKRILIMSDLFFISLCIGNCKLYTQSEKQSETL